MDLLHKIGTAVDLALSAINAIPVHSWYIFGLLVASGITASVIVAATNYHHKYKNGVTLTKHVIGYILTVIATGLSIADYYLSGSSNFAQYFGSAAPTIFAFATMAHQFGGSVLYKKAASAIGKWADGRDQPKQSIFTSTLHHSPTQPVDTAPEDKTLFG